MRSRNATAGFTLVELVITITLLGVLLAIGVPAMQQLTLNQGVKSAAFDLFTALEYARSEAIKRPGETVSLKAGAQSDGAWSTGWRLLDGSGNKLRSWTVASTITAVEKHTTEIRTITFAKDGHLTAAPKIEVYTTETMNGVEPRCVQIDLIGRPKSTMGACP